MKSMSAHIFNQRKIQASSRNIYEYNMMMDIIFHLLSLVLVSVKETSTTNAEESRRRTPLEWTTGGRDRRGQQKKDLDQFHHFRKMLNKGVFCWCYENRPSYYYGRFGCWRIFDAFRVVVEASFDVFWFHAANFQDARAR